MSTRCRIGQRDDEGGVSVIVVGIDGSPSVTGLLLAHHYLEAARQRILSIVTGRTAPDGRPLQGGPA